jgi:hypothetical protein
VRARQQQAVADEHAERAREVDPDRDDEEAAEQSTNGEVQERAERR